jgi:DNA-binding transcriptional ArsR family regulator
MESSLLSCILHPVRMRIIQALMKNKKMTVQQIAKELPEVPQATLYRHLNKLVKAKAIVVVEENKIRGVVERVYGIEADPYAVAAKDLSEQGKAEHVNLFYQFLMTLLGDFERYLDSGNVDLMRDGVMFRSAAMYASDEEYKEFLKDYIKALDKIRDNGPSPERRLRKITTILMPNIDGDKE